MFTIQSSIGRLPARQDRLSHDIRHILVHSPSFVSPVEFSGVHMACCMLRDKSFNIYIRVCNRTPTVLQTNYKSSMERGRMTIPQDSPRLVFSSILKDKSKKQLAVCPKELTLSSFSLIVSKMWDVYVTNVVLTGLWISRVNTDHTSLLFSWMVCLCDLVYITDAFARSTKRVYRSATSMDLALLFDYRSPISNFELFVIAITSLTFVPYHVLVILEVDTFCVYFVLCMLRLARLWRSGRINVVSAFSFMAKNGHLLISEQNKDHIMEAKTGRCSQEDEKNQFSRKRSAGDKTPQASHGLLSVLRHQLLDIFSQLQNEFKAQSEMEESKALC